MPHDKSGKPLAIGDEVVVRFKVTNIHASETACNCVLETVELMDNMFPTTFSYINTKQLEKV